MIASALKTKHIYKVPGAQKSLKTGEIASQNL